MCMVIIRRRYNVVVFGWFSQPTAETQLPDAPPSKSPFAALRWLHLAVARNFSSGMVVWMPTDGDRGAFYRQSPQHASVSSTTRSACAYRRQKRQSPHGRSLSRPTRRGQGSTAGTSPRSRSCRRRTDRGTRRCRRRRTSTRIHPSSITQFYRSDSAVSTATHCADSRLQAASVPSNCQVVLHRGWITGP